MADFNRAMSQMLAVFTKELGGKVTVQEIEPMPRLGFLAIPGTEYSDRIYREYYPRKETAEVIKATAFLRKIVDNRRNPPKPTNKFSLSEFTQAMSEVLKVFTEECGGSVSLAELGPNLRLSMFTKTGVEQSDLLYKEFYPKRETAELKKAIMVLKEIARKRTSSVYSSPTPKRREPQTIYTSYTPTKEAPMAGSVDISRFYNPAKPLVRKAVMDTMKPDPTRQAGVMAEHTVMVFDYLSFTMKPVGSFV